MKIGLVQINNSFLGQYYLPYSVALLEAYLKKHSKRANELEFGLPIFSRIKVKEAVEKLVDSDVVFFSLYVWNAEISLKIAEELENVNPKVKIVFGGPQVPDRIKSFAEKYPFIDFYVAGEGESTILNIIDTDFGFGISGTSVWKDEKLHTFPKCGRIKDLNSIPSPFLEGIFDILFETYPKYEWIACWETDRGCPFSCTFCDWGSNTMGKVSQFDLERIYKEIEWFSQKRIDYVFCCNANFGILPRDIEIAKKISATKVNTGYPKRLSVQNTKNATERSYQVQKILSDNGLNKGVTLSMQSLDIATLENIKRANISLDSYQELQRRFTKDNIETYTDLILGLPGETYESYVEGIDKIIQNGQHNRIQFNNLSILPNAEMADPEYVAKFELQTVESDIINMHGALNDLEYEIPEKQKLVVSTKSMPKEKWVMARTISWMVNFLYFNKIFQIPILLASKLTSVSYKVIFEAFVENDLKEYSTLTEIRQFFVEKALDIQGGGVEYCLSKEYLNIYWPVDELILIRLVFEGKIDKFFEEATTFLQKVILLEYPSIHPIIQEASILNKEFLKLPFQTSDKDIKLSYNIFEYYRKTVDGVECLLEEKPETLTINKTTEVWNTIEDYCREVIWYGNKKGAYLYGNPIFDKRLAGIH